MPRPFLPPLIASIRQGLLCFLALATAAAQTPRDAVVEVSATIQESPPQITLQWQPTAYPVTLQKVFRRSQGATVWTDLATPAVSALTHVDTTVSVGAAYEYFVYRDFNTTDPAFAAGYLSAGIRVPLVENRGHVILLVDDTMSAPLAAELARFIDDLTGDGWKVSRQDVSRGASVTSIKATVQMLSSASSEFPQALILFGRVPVPYSGDIAPDGHPDHRGAWPADVYYGDLDGVWTDELVDNSNAARVENRNIPGDSKFDQGGLPSLVELAVGRIDLSSMGGVPGGGVSETELLRQYLHRDHDFRHKLGAFASIPRRGLVDDNFGYFGGESFSANGWRNFTAFFGAGNVAALKWFDTLTTESYLCAYGCGAGTYVGAGGVGESGHFGTRNSRAVFTMLFGSYFGDWDTENSFLRAPLAGLPGSFGLASMWAGRPHWHLYSMGLGGTIGEAARATQNNAGFGAGGYVVNSAGRGVHVALLGDPTLRLHPVAPVTNLNANIVSGVPALGWTASADGAIEGYHVYRAPLAGSFVRLGSAPITGLSFADRSGVPGQNYRYMVRAKKLEHAPGGTYLNSSQGVFVNASLPSPAGPELNLTGSNQTIADDDTGVSRENLTDFGGVEAGGASEVHTFTIRNDGNATLNLVSLQISGGQAGDFVASSFLPGALAPGASADFQITFAPSSQGLRHAEVHLTSDDADESSFDFGVRGNGVPPTPQLGLDHAAIARVLAPGASTVAPVMVANTGFGTLQHSARTSFEDYTFRTGTEFGGPGYAWIEISETGTELTGFGNPDDAITGLIDLGFTFPFYGQNFTQVRVCTNAFLCFTEFGAPFANTGLPTIEAPGNFIAAFWDDLLLDDEGRIFTQQIGDLFVVQFDNIRLFNSPTQRVTCEIVLHASGEILIQYKDVSVTDHDYTVGIQNEQRTEGLEIALNTAFAQPGLAVRIVPPDLSPWLSLSGSPGSVPPNSEENISATLNAGDLSPGFYSARIAVESNAGGPLLTIPVELTVSGPEAEVLGNGLTIVNGEHAPSAVAQTDFGLVRAAGGLATRTFTIRNNGSAPLSVGTISITGDGFTFVSLPAASIPPLSHSEFAVKFAPTTAGSVMGSISIATNDADESIYEFTVSGVGITPVEAWRLTHFENISNTGVAADTADPENDGVRNVLEYAFALSPLTASTTGLPLVSRNTAGYLQILFTRHSGNTDLIYVVEASSNLAAWTPLASSSAGAPTLATGAHSVNESGSGELKTVRVEDAVPTDAQTARFLRVRIVRD